MTETTSIPKCRILPLPNHEVAFLIAERERVRWHYGTQYPRPFFYPLIGPSGQSVTRMGHPGAANHEHHRSVWFAHEKVLGINFWSDRTDARITQPEWLAYQDADQEAVMAVRLHWKDGHEPTPLFSMELVAAVRPGENEEFFLELQGTLTPTASQLELGQTNFGLLGIRMAKHLSAFRGTGLITDSEGREGEPKIFGQHAAWMDYSGRTTTSYDPKVNLPEGITCFDHPQNPTYPSAWHVREDGWMGPSLCRHKPITLLRQSPLRLRYLLHIHGVYHHEDAAVIHEKFSNSPTFTVSPSSKPHRQYEIIR